MAGLYGLLAPKQLSGRLVVGVPANCGFERVPEDRFDKVVVETTLVTAGDIETRGWVGLSAEGMLWVSQANVTSGMPADAVLRTLRTSGLQFLTGEGTALLSLQEFGQLESTLESCTILAFDGNSAAAFAVMDGCENFCQDIEPGCYKLGISQPMDRKERQRFEEVALRMLAKGEHNVDTGGIFSAFCDGTGNASSPPVFIHIIAGQDNTWGCHVHEQRGSMKVEVETLRTGSADPAIVIWRHPRVIKDQGVLSWNQQDARQSNYMRTTTGDLSCCEYVVTNNGSSQLKLSISFAGNGKASTEMRRAPKRQKKDPNRPRGYISAFNFFVQIKRPHYLNQHPQVQDMSIEQNNVINKVLGRLWKLATKDERRVYEEMATKDKLRYLREMKAYRPTQGYEREAPRINIPKGGDSKALALEFDTPLAAMYLPRPKPAYTHFAHQDRRGVLSSGSVPAKALMSKTFAQRWQAMPSEEVTLYHELEYADKERYYQDAKTHEDHTSTASGL